VTALPPKAVCMCANNCIYIYIYMCVCVSVCVCVCVCEFFRCGNAYYPNSIIITDFV
jgi:hypothetical protein